MIINLMNNLLERNFIRVENEVAILSEKFKEIIEHEEWIRVDVPL